MSKSLSEQEYFARIEVEKKRKLAEQQLQGTEEERRAELKKLHFMKCPKCGMDLLDAGELEQILEAGTEKAGGVMRAVSELFRR
jgi:hypothetical protein